MKAVCLTGNAYDYYADEKLELLTGSAGALQVFFDEQDIGSIGLIGQVSYLVFTPNGLLMPTATVTPTPTLTPQETTSPTITPPPQPLQSRETMTQGSDPSYHLISLGCPKNLVDSESMAELLNRQGYHPVDNSKSATYLIVNTCGFLKAAREEAIAIMTDLAGEKKPHQKIIAAGCMTELHRQELLDAVPGIDGLLGTRRWMDILDVIHGTEEKHSAIPYTHFPEAASVGTDEKGTYRAAVQEAAPILKLQTAAVGPAPTA